MCGIVGIFNTQDSSVRIDKSTLDEALNEIHYRGPDDKGVYISNNYALGHVRLSIIDLTKNGHQPMLTRSDRCVITYNGEVYNFEKLKTNLEQEGVIFTSKTDTEVILELFEKYGISSFEKLNGMFAYCVVDKTQKKAFLVRDRFGIKPLYYFTDQDKFVFSSEIKAISNICGYQGINEKALSEWSYFGNTLQSQTLHQGIKQLLPGCYIEIDTETLKFKENSYSKSLQTSHTSKVFTKGEKSTVKSVQNLLENAVCSQLISDVPVGVFLSGGLDSSAITAFASKNYARKIDTFSVGFDFEVGEGELPKAAEVAKFCNTNHHEIRISGYDVADVVEKMVYHHDGPFSDAANIPLYLLAQKVKNQVKVVLQGDGGDEIFAGYRRYNTLAMRPLWRPFIRSASKFHKVFFKKNQNFFSRQRYLNALNTEDEAELMALLLTVEDKEITPLKIFNGPVFDRIKVFDPFESYRFLNNKFSKEDLVQRMLYTDINLILPSIFLEKVDRSTMAASLEVRVPFLDNSLSNFVMSLPSNEKIKKGQKKWLLKEAMKDILPANIIHAKKTGFSVPYNLWLKGPLYQLFNDKKSQLQTRNCSLLDWKYIDRLMYENSNGFRNHGFILWKVLNLMIWLSNNE